MTAKPIVVAYLPANKYDRDIWGTCQRSQEYLAEKTNNEYYCFCFPANDVETIEFKVFYEKDFTPIQYEELKKLITDSLTQQNKDQ